MKRTRPLAAAVLAAVLIPAAALAGAPSEATADGPGAAPPRSVAAAQAEPDVFSHLRWRSIGPANMMGRIASIDALNDDHRVVLVASASGGVFLSDNAGVTWDPIFDSSGGAGSIGAAVLFQGDPDVIWVGTGEAANRNSSGWGDGLWRTTDGGETWANVGLEETGHVAEIATHPTDPDVAYVASPGHLWGYSGSRGLWRTRDGGVTWEKLGEGLPDDGRTGCTEIAMHPEDPDVLYAGFYHRIRQPATMYSGGEAGGLFKSVDGGDTWRKLGGGLPEVTGMIDVDIHRADPEIVVAAVESDDSIPFAQDPAERAANPGGGIYVSRDAGETWEWSLKTVVRPFYHGQVAVDPLDPDRIYSVGREFKVSKDGGETWIDRWWGGGGDDHDLWIAPYDGDVRYTATDQGAYLTLDDGETVLAFDNMAIGQYYKIGVDMRDPYWVGGGLQDNAIWIGPSNSREVRGILNMHHTWLAEGDGFATLVDPDDWRTLYGVNHVGFAVRLDRETRDYTYITPTPETVTNFDEWAEPGYPEEPVDYTIDPGEHWFFGERAERPLLPPQFRFNWNAPLVMSPSNPHTLYFGGNHLFKTVDRGEAWRILSPDLTANDPELRNPSRQGGLTRSVTGGENHFTIFTIAESPLDPALLWVGTDDGNVWISRDGGAEWTNVRDDIPGIPERIWANHVVASAHDHGTAYVVFDNHRLDDMKAYVLRTTDHGATWADISGDLPDGGASYVLAEDPVNPELLFVGTEFGVWGTIDGGQHWEKLSRGMPAVAVRDLVIHPREMDLVAGTHGRSIYILDDLTALQQLRPEVRESRVGLLEPKRATKWVRVNLGRKQQDFLFRGENPPYGALIHYWLGREPAGDVSLVVEEVAGDRRVELYPGPPAEGPEEPEGRRRRRRGPENPEPRAGVNRARWDLTFPSTPLQRRRMRDRLRRAIETLADRVRDPELGDGLAAYAERLQAIDLRGDEADDALDELRGHLVREYNAYAGGRPLFGPKIGPTTADAGTYRVVLRIGDVERVTRLVVRDDPLGDDPCGVQGGC